MRSFYVLLAEDATLRMPMTLPKTLLPPSSALAVGLRVCGLLLFINSMVALPLLADQLDFNHYHPEDTLEHYHSLSMLLGVLAVAVKTPLLLERPYSHRLPRLPPCRQFFYRSLADLPPIRAPPLVPSTTSL